MQSGEGVHLRHGEAAEGGPGKCEDVQDEANTKRTGLVYGQKQLNGKRLLIVFILIGLELLHFFPGHLQWPLYFAGVRRRRRDSFCRSVSEGTPRLHAGR